QGGWTHRPNALALERFDRGYAGDSQHGKWTMRENGNGSQTAIIAKLGNVCRHFGISQHALCMLKIIEKTWDIKDLETGIHGHKKAGRWNRHLDSAEGNAL